MFKFRKKICKFKSNFAKFKNNNNRFLLCKFQTNFVISHEIGLNVENYAKLGELSNITLNKCINSIKFNFSLSLKIRSVFVNFSPTFIPRIIL